MRRCVLCVCPSNIIINQKISFWFMTVCWLGVAKLFISTLSSFLGDVSPINQPTNRYQNVYSAKGMATASDQYGQFLMQYGATSSSSSLNGESAEGFATRAGLARRRQSQKEKRDRKEASSHHHRRTTTTTTKGTTPVAIVSTSIPQSSNVTRRLRNSNKNAGKPQPKVPAMPAPMVREREERGDGHSDDGQMWSKMASFFHAAFRNDFPLVACSAQIITNYHSHHQKISNHHHK